MKLVKEIATGNYKIISDNQLTDTPNIYFDRSDAPLYWDKYGQELSDIILVKANIKRIYDMKGWEAFKGMSEKEVIAKRLAYSMPNNELLEVLTEAQIKESKREYVLGSKLARENRWEFLRSELALKVDQLQSLAFYTDTKVFKGDYIDVGLPNLELWLTNGVYPALGIDFSTTGFSNQPYFSEEMRDMCIAYLTLGEQFIST